jgi:hypothetical protein
VSALLAYVAVVIVDLVSYSIAVAFMLILLWYMLTGIKIFHLCSQVPVVVIVCYMPPPSCYTRATQYLLSVIDFTCFFVGVSACSACFQIC